MKADQIRTYFAPNWVFRLYLSKRIPYPAIVVLVPLLIWLIGAIGAALLGVFPLFMQNVLAYPAGLGFALAAYGWFARVFPGTLEAIFPALDMTPKRYGDTIRKWADRIANRLWVFVLFSIPIAALSLQRIASLWVAPDLNWIGAEWVRSDQSLFFALYYGFYDTLVAGFLLGSGAGGIVGCMVLLYDLLSNPLRLVYYRQMRAVGNFSMGLAFWAFIAFVFVGLAQSLIGQDLFSGGLTSAPVLPTVILGGIASLALLAALFAPVAFARQAIVRAKEARIASLEDVQHKTHQAIERITKELASNQRQASTDASKGEGFEQLNAHLENLRAVTKLIEEIESIPNWPLTWRGTLQILVAALTPSLSTLIDTLTSALRPQ